METKISIITPNYNGAEFLEETIKSVINQGYRNLEYIIIDGGSTDGSVDIIKKYEENLAYWVSEPDAGLYHAIQKGFERSTGDIMAWINSDDKYHPGAFSIINEVFNQFPQISWVQGIPSIYDEAGRTVMVDRRIQWCQADIFMGYTERIQQESTFWRRSLWEKAGSQLNAELRYAADFELWLRFFKHEQLYSLKSLLSGFRFRSSYQVSMNNLDKYSKEIQDCIAAEFNKMPADYQFKINKIKEFRNAMNNKNRFLRSLYFRRHHKRIQQYEAELFKYPLKMDFDRITQRFYLHD